MLAETINSTIPAQGELFIWWLGQSGFIIRTADTCVLTDPYLSTTLEEDTLNDPVKQHVRMMPVALPPEELHCLDYILCSHGHRDHCDRISVMGALEGSPHARIIVPPAVAAEKDWLPKESVDTFPTGTAYNRGSFSIKTIPAKHNDFDRSEKYGYPYVGFIIRFGDFCIYHAGDCIMYDELPEILRKEKIDLGIVPINGWTEELIRKGFKSNFTYTEAVDLCRDAGIKTMIPCHYDMFTINTEKVENFISYANRCPGAPPYIIPHIGEPIRIKTV